MALAQVAVYATKDSEPPGKTLFLQTCLKEMVTFKNQVTENKTKFYRSCTMEIMSSLGILSW